MSPDEIPEFWRGLHQAEQVRRRAYAAVLPHLDDRRAVPYLLHTLHEQPDEIAQPMVACLGRLGDARALPVLADTVHSRSRLLRSEAQAAIAAIQRAEREHPARTLLRPARSHVEHRRSLLRPAGTGEYEPSDQLLRSIAPEGIPPHDGN
jgi:hypothetical protein